MVAQQQSEMRAQQQLLNLLANAVPTGRIVLGIKPAARSVDDIPDMVVEDGDDLMIPPQLGTVQVTGEVYNPCSLRYQENKRLMNYLNDSGGPNRTADTKKIFVIRADGTVVARQSEHSPWGNRFENMILMPGDAIVTPPKLRSHNAFVQNLPGIFQMLSSGALTGAIIATH